MILYFFFISNTLISEIILYFARVHLLRQMLKIQNVLKRAFFIITRPFKNDHFSISNFQITSDFIQIITKNC